MTERRARPLGKIIFNYLAKPPILVSLKPVPAQNRNPCSCRVGVKINLVWLYVSEGLKDEFLRAGSDREACTAIRQNEF